MTTLQKELRAWLWLIAFVLGTILGGTASHFAGPSSTRTVTDTQTQTATVTQTVTSSISSPNPTTLGKHYLTHLTNTQGETPEPGSIEIAGQSYPNSIFWENASAEGSDGHCAKQIACRTAIYNLEGKYQLFVASVGGSIKGTETATGHWWVVRDGQIEQGSFNFNQRPHLIKLSVAGVHTLELSIQAELGTEEPALVWGEAYVS